MDWYYLESNQQVGPVSETDFQNRLRSGTITEDTQVWHEGLTEWQRYGQLQPKAAVLTVARPASAAGTPGVVCSECGQTFASDEVIRYGNVWVCGGCKPVFVQKLKEGVVRSAALEYAGVGTRFAAVFVDGILLWVFNFVLGLIILAPLRNAATNENALLLTQGILTLIQLAIGVGYEVWFIGKYGATLGKLACKIKVVTPEGNPVSYGRAFGRYFAKILSGIILGIGYFMAAFDGEKRALHDRICSTRVIKAG